jgi:hypothetical protein
MPGAPVAASEVLDGRLWTVLEATLDVLVAPPGVWGNDGGDVVAPEPHCQQYQADGH